jgi:4-amino-4-deoxy-L-arabinose transferase-like glycosyltransferase
MFHSSVKNDESVRQIVFLIAVSLACLLPFINKAFHIDDTLFILASRHIQSHPLDFYGFTVNWYGEAMPMYEVMKNPPLTSYFIGLVATFAGWSELALHVSFLIPALGVVIGTYYLAQQFCSRSLTATLVGILTPVFLVSSTTVMCDIMMLAFWVWAVVLWVRGMNGLRYSFLIAAAFLIALAGLTKYYGLSLIPLLMAYSYAKKRSFKGWAVILLIPVAILALYQIATYSMYGKGLLFDAASYASNYHSQEADRIFAETLIALSFSGGCLLTALWLFPLLWPRRIVIGTLCCLALFAASMPFLENFGVFSQALPTRVDWLLILQFSLLVFAGGNILAVAVGDLYRNRTPEALLLFLWVMGTFVFTAFINWSISGRNVLPLMPAAGILLVRRMEMRGILNHPKRPWHIALFLAPALIIALAVARADYLYADTARSAAFAVNRDFGNHRGTLWFEGHWGFQYYMEKIGAKALDFAHSRLSAKDVVVIPQYGSNMALLPNDIAHLTRTYSFESSRWITTMNGPEGAAFYSSDAGPLPYALNRIPLVKYYVFELNSEFMFTVVDNVRSQK